MSTPIIEFTQDPNEDITNTPQHYHNFAGASVRVRFYWTTPILSNPGLLAHSFNLIRAADEILRKYTLRLDPQPSLASASAAFYAAAQAKAYAALSR